MKLNNKYLWTIIYFNLSIPLLLAGGEPVKFVFHAPGAVQSVHLGGTFNNWSPSVNPLSDEDGDNCWECTLFLPYGRYEYRFLVNNKNWLRDPLNPRYGGAFSNSIKIVKNPDFPDFQVKLPKNGAIIQEQKIKILAEFIPGARGVDLSIDSTLILCDDIRQKFSYNTKNRLLECHISPCAEGEHRIRIVPKDKAGHVIEPVERVVIINQVDLPPIAHAGFTKITRCSKPIQLNAGLSYDPDLDPITRFEWKIIEAPIGSQAALENPASPFPDFQPDLPGRYLFCLRIYAGNKPSLPDTTDVWAMQLPVQLTPFKYDSRQFVNPVEQVCLVGEFNGWQANQMMLKKTATDGLWETAVELAPGEYEYKFVINQHHWLPDPANPLRIADGWNGFNSIKRVENKLSVISDFDLKYDDSQISIKPVTLPKERTTEFAWFQDIQNPAFHSPEMLQEPIFHFPRKNGLFDLYLMNWNQQAAAPMINLHLKMEAEQVNISIVDNSPAWCNDAIIYEIYVRQFTKEGTLNGVRSRLPYLKDLGINCIWLMPIFESPSEHGYAPSDFLKVNPEYGTSSDLEKLIQTAHENGIKVVLDFIANHSGDQHPYFKSAFENPESAFRDWYTWHSSTLLADRLNYAYHNDWDSLPNLNFQNPQVWHFMLKVAKYWLELGVDGFRCDVAWGVPHPFWKTFRRELKKINPEFLLLNEVLPRSPEYHAAEFDMSYDTDFYGNLLDVLNQKKPITALDFGLQKAIKNYPPSAQSLRYLENHDMNRFINDFGLERTKLAATLLLTCPGTPLIYYGQEIGQRTIREAMDWEMNTPEQISLFQYYKKLIHMRKSFSALRNGSLSRIEPAVSEIYAYFRTDSVDQFLILLNFADKSVKFDLDINSLQLNRKLALKMQLIDLFDDRALPKNFHPGDQFVQILTPYEGRIFRLIF